jgi:hypothetical protein
MRSSLIAHQYIVVMRESSASPGLPEQWHRSGDLRSDMARQEGHEIGRVSRVFATDVVLALSCREAARSKTPGTLHSSAFLRAIRLRQPVKRRAGRNGTLAGVPRSARGATANVSGLDPRRDVHVEHAR